MTAPMIVRSAADYREDRQQVVVMLHDFSFRAPEEILADLTHTTPAEAERMSTRDENVPTPTTPQPAGIAATESRPAMSMAGKRDLNDVDYDAFLANDRTLSDPEVVRVSGGGRVRLRIINGSASTQFWINLGNLTGEVIAADGHPSAPSPATASRCRLRSASTSCSMFPDMAPSRSSPRSKASGPAPASSSRPRGRASPKSRRRAPMPRRRSTTPWRRSSRRSIHCRYGRPTSSTRSGSPATWGATPGGSTDSPGRTSCR
jgi:hypothetical protein